MFWVYTYYSNYSTSADNFAISTHCFYTCSNFHKILYLNLYEIRPLVLSYLLTSILTLSPGNILILNIRIFPDVCPRILSPSAVSILNCALGNVSNTVPSNSIISFLIAIFLSDIKKTRTYLISCRLIFIILSVLFKSTDYFNRCAIY